MWCVQRRACPRPLHLNLSPRAPTPLINYKQRLGRLSKRGLKQRGLVRNLHLRCVSDIVELFQPIQWFKAEAATTTLPVLDDLCCVYWRTCSSALHRQIYEFTPQSADQLPDVRCSPFDTPTILSAQWDSDLFTPPTARSARSSASLMVQRWEGSSSHGWRRSRVYSFVHNSPRFESAIYKWGIHTSKIRLLVDGIRSIICTVKRRSHRMGSRLTATGIEMRTVLWFVPQS